MVLWKIIFFYRNEKTRYENNDFSWEKHIQTSFRFSLVNHNTDKLTNQLKEGMCAWPATPAKSAGKRVVTGRDWIFSHWLKTASDYYPKPITKHIIFVYLCPRFNEFQKVRPGLVDLIFPLGDSGSVSVTCANKLITHSIRGCHLFRSSIGGISCEIAEFLNEQLLKSW